MPSKKSKISLEKLEEEIKILQEKNKEFEERLNKMEGRILDKKEATQYKIEFYKNKSEYHRQNALGIPAIVLSAGTLAISGISIYSQIPVKSWYFGVIIIIGLLFLFLLISRWISKISHLGTKEERLDKEYSKKAVEYFVQLYPEEKEFLKGIEEKYKK